MRVGYRLRQFWRTIAAEPMSLGQLEEVRAVLSADETELFLRYDPTDQQHCFRVLQTLRDAGVEDHDLLVAALLHDIGKTQVRLTALDRMVGTVAERTMPGRMAQWGTAAPPVGWRKPFVVRVNHATWGAEMAQQAGSSPTAVCLIRRHQDRIGDGLSQADLQLLYQLQWADELN